MSTAIAAFLRRDRRVVDDPLSGRRRAGRRARTPGRTREASHSVLPRFETATMASSAGARSRSASPVPATNACVRRLPVPPRHELHVHRGRLGVSEALAAGEQLLERVREQLVGGHVLPARRAARRRRSCRGWPSSRGSRWRCSARRLGGPARPAGGGRGSPRTSATWWPPIIATESVISTVARRRSKACRAAEGSWARRAAGGSSGRALREVQTARRVAARQCLKPRLAVVPPARVDGADGDRRDAVPVEAASPCAMRWMIWNCWTSCW